MPEPTHPPTAGPSAALRQQRALADATIRALRALAQDPAAAEWHRGACTHAADLLTAAVDTAARWGGPHNAETRADVLMPTTVRGTGAAGRNALIESLDELTRRCGTC